ncbi:MAG TPA: CBS domain-containing protein [Candidatus Xenobia bacterium]|jgi:CBS domain-containing protein
MLQLPTTTFISKLLRAPIVDSDGRHVGRLDDLVIQHVGDQVEVRGLVVRQGRRKFVMVSAEALRNVTGDHLTTPGQDISMRTSPLQLRSHLDVDDSFPPEDEQFRLARDVLDAQVIDMDGAKVIRVNDIQLEWIGDRLIVSGLDIGAWGVCRRLGLAPLLAAITRRFHLEIPEGVVPLNQVAPLSKGPSLQLSVPTQQLSLLHPADLARIVAELGHDHRQAILSEMSVEQTADLVEESDANVGKAILEDLGEERAADVLDAMQPDEAADLLSEVPEEHRDRLMDLMEPEGAEKVRALMQWPDGTAGALMNTNYWSLPVDLTVGEAIARLRGGIPLCEEVLHVYVVDAEHHLQGVIHLRRLLAASDETPIREVMETDVDKVTPEAQIPDIRHLILRYNLLALPVVEDEQAKLLGVVTIHDVLDLLLSPEEP